MKYLSAFLISCLLFSCSSSKTGSSVSSYEDQVAKYQKYEGFFDYYWSAKEGKVFLEITRLDEEFLYVNYLAAGIGSNDIGLDRGQVGDNRIVKFIRSGPKVLMIQPNYRFRATSENKEEVRSVEEAFAQSVLWGFKVTKEKNGKLLVDITDFLLSDVHGVSERLKASKQGTYKIDETRSAIYLPMTKNFTDNSEFESTITFKGTSEGDYIQSVAPTSESITVRMHHSFVRLPDDGYKSRAFDPRSGFYAMEYQDYATPIEDPLVKRFIYRHRLEKKYPDSAVSEPVKPIIYYVDKGAPEPVKTALIEGASWWNQAFEKAGYKNAFQVAVLPDSADPLDINYNVIQWVHRSTRGWSYGSWIADPRTGEILKGHVSLGSLRIRQDFLIATGLLQPYDGEEIPGEMLEMALARLRQLSAHEVGHTLGLYHNFAASVNDRASVMDYPHPYIQLDAEGEIDLTHAYDSGIGAWDQYAIRYGYSEFTEQEDPNAELDEIINEWIAKGYQFITDADARPESGANATAHLWDTGKNAADELYRLTNIRKKVLENFSEKAIREGDPISSLEEVLVPMYFLHRYQIEAASKLVGGSHYTYKVKGDELPYPKAVSPQIQEIAIRSLCQTLSTSFLEIPTHLQEILSPKVPGFDRTRESFRSNTGPMFDPVAAAETSAEMTLRMLFNPERIERLIQQNLKDPSLPGWENLIKAVYAETWNQPYPGGLAMEIKLVVEKRVLYHLMNLAVGSSTEAVKSVAFAELESLIISLNKKSSRNGLVAAHYQHSKRVYQQFLEDPEAYKIPKAPEPPDGSPIGMGCLMEE